MDEVAVAPHCRGSIVNAETKARYEAAKTGNA